MREKFEELERKVQIHKTKLQNFPRTYCDENELQWMRNQLSTMRNDFKEIVEWARFEKDSRSRDHEIFTSKRVLEISKACEEKGMKFTISAAERDAHADPAYREVIEAQAKAIAFLDRVKEEVESVQQMINSLASWIGSLNADKKNHFTHWTSEES